MIKAVLFDLDMTLLDRDRTYRAYAYDLVSRYTEDPERKVRIAEAMIRLDRHGYGQPFETFRPLMEEFHLRKDSFNGQWTRFVEKNVHRYPDSEAVLTALQKKYRLGLVSNGAGRTQWNKLNASGFTDFFETVVFSGEVGIEKPDPAIFHIALEKMGLSPAQAVYIGDHPVNDGVGALGAGMRMVWIDHGLHEDVPEKALKRLGEAEGSDLVRISDIAYAEDALAALEQRHG